MTNPPHSPRTHIHGHQTLYLHTCEVVGVQYQSLEMGVGGEQTHINQTIALHVEYS